ncbi:MAG: hypothetical protein KatS3mg007_0477 [Thermoanaerobaculum sp.]|nr:MAG: hypothetical protein KatS3mg007_0477 [Thermoanaerobaculum sp.]GBC79468.1 hypothetical protein HRbin09_00687 [bacterium HR09]
MAWEMCKGFQLGAGLKLDGSAQAEVWLDRAYPRRGRCLLARRHDRAVRRGEEGEKPGGGGSGMRGVSRSVRGGVEIRPLSRNRRDLIGGDHE